MVCQLKPGKFNIHCWRGQGVSKMNIHEYQAKAVLHEFGVPVSRAVPIFRASEAEAAAKQLGGPIWVGKSQIHAGGRGKGKLNEAPGGANGGVRRSQSLYDVQGFAQQ